MQKKNAISVAFCPYQLELFLVISLSAAFDRGTMFDFYSFHLYILFFEAKKKLSGCSEKATLKISKLDVLSLDYKQKKLSWFEG